MVEQAPPRTPGHPRTFLAAQAVAAGRERSRSTSGPNVAHPDTRRVYPLRSYLFGKTRRGLAYYSCQPSADYRGPDHPTSLWVHEKALLDGVAASSPTASSAPTGCTYLADVLARIDGQAARDHHARIAAARRAIGDIDIRRARLVRSLEHTDDPHGDLIRDIRAPAAQLAADRAAKLAELSDLENTAPIQPAPELLDALPLGAVDLADAPVPVLHHLFEAFRLELRYNKPTNTATCRVTILPETLPELRHAATRLLQHQESHEGDHCDAAPVPICVAPPAGLEPASPDLGGPRSVP